MKTLSESSKEKLILSLPLLFLVFILIRTAWVSDDAYISFRTIYNFFHGHGMRWNIAERVQSFTHPLWFFLLTCFYFITREIHITSMIVSVGITTGALTLWFFRASKSNIDLTFISLLALIFSRAFIDYSTSGLENPLSYLILVAFVLKALENKPLEDKAFLLSFIASLGMLNRQDHFLLFFPPLAYILFSRRSLKTVGAMVSGFIPLFAWELFSLLYYGFPFPNTAYAKLNTGIPLFSLVRQGFFYYQNAFANDPITLATIVLGLSSVLVKPSWLRTSLALGIVLYLAYILKIGGDFMSGRFFSSPVLLSALLISLTPIGAMPRPLFALVVSATVILGMSAPRPTVLSDADYEFDKRPFAIVLREDKGIIDERAFYYQQTGLLNLEKGKENPNHLWYKQGLSIKKQGITPYVRGTVGFFGWAVGPKIHIIDYFALCDPLAARLPNDSKIRWRIGHFGRTLPIGYVETLKVGKNLIKDKSIAEYYDYLSLITRGSLWSRKRLLTILKMNLGSYDYLIEEYLKPERTIPLKDIETPKAVGTFWRAKGNIILDNKPIIIDLGKTYNSSELTISLDHNDHYLLSFYQDDRLVGESPIVPSLIRGGGLNVYRIKIDKKTQEHGFNRVHVKYTAGDELPSLGHINFDTVLEP
jgi:arabinofuranosyltransferase